MEPTAKKPKGSTLFWVPNQADLRKRSLLIACLSLTLITCVSCSFNRSYPAQIGLSFGEYRDSCDLAPAEFTPLANGFTIGECIGKPTEYTVFEMGKSVAILSETRFTDWLIANYCRPEDSICANDKADAVSMSTELKFFEQRSELSITNAPLIRTVSSVAKSAYLVTEIPELQAVQTTPFPTNGSLSDQTCQFIGETVSQSGIKSCHFNCIANGVLTKNIKLYADCQIDGDFNRTN